MRFNFPLIVLEFSAVVFAKEDSFDSIPLGPASEDNVTKAHNNPTVYDKENYMDQFTAKEGYITEKRPVLPPKDPFNLDGEIPSLKCGEGTAVVTEGFKYFKLNYTSEGDSSLCYHAFFGSWMYNCTVAIVCNKTLQLSPPTNGICSEDRLMLFDGTDGLVIACGNFSFNTTPVYAANGGHDLYMFYRGESDAVCLAFCKQDLSPDHEGAIGIPRPITKVRRKNGLGRKESCVCGRRKEPGRYTRIVNGDNALMYEFPWITAIVPKEETKNRLPFCGASLISDQFLLSAAHCFMVKYNRTYYNTMDPKDVQGVLHAHVMNKPMRPSDSWTNHMIPGWNLPPVTDEDEDSIRVDIESITVHPLFHPKSLDWDIAIIKLKDRINLTDPRVLPICLPKIKDRVHFKDNQFHTVAGWVCQKYALPTKRHICGAYHKVGKGRSPCEGDSGGPMMYKFRPKKNQYMLSGIMIGKDGNCGKKDFMNLFTNVQELLQWIYRHTFNSTWCKL